MTTNTFVDKKVLVVGDGDLSFAASLALQIDDTSNLTASVYESEQEFCARYATNSAGGLDASGAVNLKTLKMYGANLVYGVDATNIQLKDELTGELRKWDVIIWNFPYPIVWTKDDVLEKSRRLMGDFFRSASNVLAPGGEIRTSLVNN